MMMNYGTAMSLISDFSELDDVFCTVISDGVIECTDRNYDEATVSVADFVEWLSIVLSDFVSDEQAQLEIERCLEYLE